MSFRLGRNDDLPRIPSAMDASDLTSAGGAGLAMPEEEDNVMQSRVTGTVWWLFATVAVFIGFMLHEQTPKWVLAVVAAEGYASMRRLVSQLRSGRPSGNKPRRASFEAVPRHRRLRHFTSVRLKIGAPVEEIVAAFVALDGMPAVRSIELGSNFSSEGKSRNHNLGMLVTFGSQADRVAFLASERRAAFLEFAGQYVEEWFVYDFESGAV